MNLFYGIVASSSLIAATVLHVSGGHKPGPASLALLGVALVLALAGALQVRPFFDDRESGRSRLFPVAMGLFCLLNCAWLTIQMMLGRALGVPSGYMIAEGVALVAIMADYARGLRGGSWRFPAALIVFGLLGISAIKAYPSPDIDVWQLQQNACGQILRGINPYAAEHPNIPWNPKYDGLPVRSGDHLRSFPYPPLSLLLTLPGYIIGGDVRWSMLAAYLLSASMLAATGRRLGLPPGHPAELGALALLFHPFALLVIAKGWTEPLLLLFVVVSGWSVVTRREIASRASLAAVIAIKQFGFLWALSIAASGRTGRMAAAFGLVAAGIVALPFLLWDPPAFWLGTVLYVTAYPLRSESLSIPAAVAIATGYEVSGSFGLIAAGLASIGIFLRRPTQLSQIALGGAALYLLIFLFGRAAHLNYYWFAGALFNIAIVAGMGEAYQGEVDAPNRTCEGSDMPNDSVSDRR